MPAFSSSHCFECLDIGYVCAACFVICLMITLGVLYFTYRSHQGPVITDHQALNSLIIQPQPNIVRPTLSSAERYDEFWHQSITNRLDSDHSLTVGDQVITSDPGRSDYDSCARILVDEVMDTIVKEYSKLQDVLSDSDGDGAVNKSQLSHLPPIRQNSGFLTAMEKVDNPKTLLQLISDPLDALFSSPTPKSGDQEIEEDLSDFENTSDSKMNLGNNGMDLEEQVSTASLRTNHHSPRKPKESFKSNSYHFEKSIQWMDSGSDTPEPLFHSEGHSKIRRHSAIDYESKVEDLEELEDAEILNPFSNLGTPHNFEIPKSPEKHGDSDLDDFFDNTQDAKAFEINVFKYQFDTLESSTTSTLFNQSSSTNAHFSDSHLKAMIPDDAFKQNLKLHLLDEIEAQSPSPSPGYEPIASAAPERVRSAKKVVRARAELRLLRKDSASTSADEVEELEDSLEAASATKMYSGLMTGGTNRVTSGKSKLEKDPKLADEVDSDWPSYDGDSFESDKADNDQEKPDQDENLLLQSSIFSSQQMAQLKKNQPEFDADSIAEEIHTENEDLADSNKVAEAVSADSLLSELSPTSPKVSDNEQQVAPFFESAPDEGMAIMDEDIDFLSAITVSVQRNSSIQEHDTIGTREKPDVMNFKDPDVIGSETKGDISPKSALILKSPRSLDDHQMAALLDMPTNDIKGLDNDNIQNQRIQAEIDSDSEDDEYMRRLTMASKKIDLVANNTDHTHDQSSIDHEVIRDKPEHISTNHDAISSPHLNDHAPISKEMSIDHITHDVIDLLENRFTTDQVHSSNDQVVPDQKYPADNHPTPDHTSVLHLTTDGLTEYPHHQPDQSGLDDIADRDHGQMQSEKAAAHSLAVSILDMLQNTNISNIQALDIHVLTLTMDNLVEFGDQKLPIAQLPSEKFEHGIVSHFDSAEKRLSSTDVDQQIADQENHTDHQVISVHLGENVDGSSIVLSSLASATLNLGSEGGKGASKVVADLDQHDQIDHMINANMESKPDGALSTLAQSSLNLPIHLALDLNSMPENAMSLHLDHDGLQENLGDPPKFSPSQSEDALTPQTIRSARKIDKSSDQVASAPDEHERMLAAFLLASLMPAKHYHIACSDENSDHEDSESAKSQPAIHKRIERTATDPGYGREKINLARHLSLDQSKVSVFALSSFMEGVPEMPIDEQLHLDLDIQALQYEPDGLIEDLEAVITGSVDSKIEETEEPLTPRMTSNHPDSGRKQLEAIAHSGHAKLNVHDNDLQLPDAPDHSPVASDVETDEDINSLEGEEVHVKHLDEMTEDDQRPEPLSPFSHFMSLMESLPEGPDGLYSIQEEDEDQPQHVRPYVPPLDLDTDDDSIKRAIQSIQIPGLDDTETVTVTPPAGSSIKSTDAIADLTSEIDMFDRSECSSPESFSDIINQNVNPLIHSDQNEHSPSHPIDPFQDAVIRSSISDHPADDDQSFDTSFTQAELQPNLDELLGSFSSSKGSLHSKPPLSPMTSLKPTSLDSPNSAKIAGSLLEMSSNNSDYLVSSYDLLTNSPSKEAQLVNSMQADDILDMKNQAALQHGDTDDEFDDHLDQYPDHPGTVDKNDQQVDHVDQVESDNPEPSVDLDHPSPADWNDHTKDHTHGHRKTTDHNDHIGHPDQSKPTDDMDHPDHDYPRPIDQPNKDHLFTQKHVPLCYCNQAIGTQCMICKSSILIPETSGLDETCPTTPETAEFENTIIKSEWWKPQPSTETEIGQDSERSSSRMEKVVVFREEFFTKSTEQMESIILHQYSHSIDLITDGSEKAEQVVRRQSWTAETLRKDIRSANAEKSDWHVTIETSNLDSPKKEMNVENVGTFSNAMDSMKSWWTQEQGADQTSDQPDPNQTARSTQHGIDQEIDKPDHDQTRISNQSCHDQSIADIDTNAATTSTSEVAVPQPKMGKKNGMKYSLKKQSIEECVSSPNSPKQPFTMHMDTEVCSAADKLSELGTDVIVTPRTPAIVQSVGGKMYENLSDDDHIDISDDHDSSQVITSSNPFIDYRLPDTPRSDTEMEAPMQEAPLCFGGAVIAGLGKDIKYSENNASNSNKFTGNQQSIASIFSPMEDVLKVTLLDGVPHVSLSTRMEASRDSKSDEDTSDAEKKSQANGHIPRSSADQSISHGNGHIPGSLAEPYSADTNHVGENDTIDIDFIDDHDLPEQTQPSSIMLETSDDHLNTAMSGFGPVTTFHDFSRPSQMDNPIEAHGSDTDDDFADAIVHHDCQNGQDNRNFIYVAKPVQTGPEEDDETDIDDLLLEETHDDHIKKPSKLESSGYSYYEFEDSDDIKAYTINLNSDDEEDQEKDDHREDWHSNFYQNSSSDDHLLANQKRKAVSWSDLGKGAPLEQGPTTNKNVSPPKPIIKTKTSPRSESEVTSSSAARPLQQPQPPPRPSRPSTLFTRPPFALQDSIVVAKRNAHVGDSPSKLVDACVQTETSPGHYSRTNAVTSPFPEEPSAASVGRARDAAPSPTPVESLENLNSYNSQVLLGDLLALVHERDTVVDALDVFLASSTSPALQHFTSYSSQKYINEYANRLQTTKSELDKRIEELVSYLRRLYLDKKLPDNLAWLFSRHSTNLTFKNPPSKTDLKGSFTQSGVGQTTVAFHSSTSLGYCPRLHISPLDYRQKLLDLRKTLVQTCTDLATTYADSIIYDTFYNRDTSQHNQPSINDLGFYDKFNPTTPRQKPSQAQPRRQEPRPNMWRPDPESSDASISDTSLIGTSLLQEIRELREVSREAINLGKDALRSSHRPYHSPGSRDSFISTGRPSNGYIPSSARPKSMTAEDTRIDAEIASLLRMYRQKLVGVDSKISSHNHGTNSY